MLLARGAGMVLVGMVLVLWALGVPATFDKALRLGADARGVLDPLPFPDTVAGYYLITMDAIMMLGFTLIACLIFWRRSDDIMGVFVSSTLVLTGMLYTSPAFESTPLALLAILCALAEISQAAFLFLFPDGRWVPRRAWLILVPLLVWRPAMWWLFYLPAFYAQERSGGNFLVIPQNSLDIGLFLAVILLGVASQVYRYRRESTAVERQQMKWLLLGAFVAACVSGLYAIVINLPGVLAEGGNVVLTTFAARTVRQLAMLLVPVSLFYSILRYRLWDIDVFINRTLVYGTLTASLAMVYFGGVATLQSLVTAITGQQRSQSAIVVTTLVIAALFQPLRTRIQHFTDRRFYRRKYDATRTLETFGETLRDEVDLETMKQDLLSVVHETMQPEHVTLWLREPERNARGIVRVRTD